jgi:hypothetical protein
MGGPDELNLGHGAVSILLDLVTVANRHGNNRRRVLCHTARCLEA